MFLARRGAAPALLLTAALLAGCASAGAPGTDETLAPTPSAPSVTAEPAPNTEPEAPAALTDEDIARITDAVARDPHALLPYLATEVHVLIAATEAAGMLAPAEAVDALSYVARSPESWSFDLHWTAVARFAESSYGEFFPDGVIVGLSTEGPVVALSGADGLIDTIFMAAGPELLDG